MIKINISGLFDCIKNILCGGDLSSFEEKFLNNDIIQKSERPLVLTSSMLSLYYTVPLKRHFLSVTLCFLIGRY
jgi:hypothetical protein